MSRRSKASKLDRKDWLLLGAMMRVAYTAQIRLSVRLCEALGKTHPVSELACEMQKDMVKLKDMLDNEMYRHAGDKFSEKEIVDVMYGDVTIAEQTEVIKKITERITQ